MLKKSVKVDPPLRASTVSTPIPFKCSNFKREKFKAEDLIKLEPIESGRLFTELIGHILRAKADGNMEVIFDLRNSIDELYDFFDPVVEI